MQKTPGEGREHDGQDFRSRHAHQKTNREHAEQKLFAGRRVDADGQGINPGESGAESIGILQILRRPDAEPSPDDVKGYDESNMRGGQAQADKTRTEELARAKTG